MEGKTQEAVAAAAGMSVRTARSWQHGPLPSEGRTSRAWRTRPDSFASSWSEAVETLLQRDPERALQAITVLELLAAGQDLQLPRHCASWIILISWCWTTWAI